jgi:glutaredoxin
MSIEVKVWKPAPGCAQCKTADRLLHEDMIRSMRSHAEAMKKIKALMAEIEKLKEQNNENR